MFSLVSTYLRICLPDRVQRLCGGYRKADVMCSSAINLQHGQRSDSQHRTTHLTASNNQQSTCICSYIAYFSQCAEYYCICMGCILLLTRCRLLPTRLLAAKTCILHLACKLMGGTAGAPASPISPQQCKQGTVHTVCSYMVRLLLQRIGNLTDNPSDWLVLVS